LSEGNNEDAPEYLRVLKALTEAPWSYEFNALLRRLDASHDGPGFGRSSRPSEDIARLGQTATMSFTPSSVDSITPKPTAPRIGLSFSGLFGAHGPMPLHLTEWIHERRYRENDHTLEAFADIFHHRFFSLLFRAWVDSKPTIALHESSEKDIFRRFIGCFGGISGNGMNSLEDHGRRYYMGHIGAGPARPEALEQILRDRFNVFVQVHEFIGEWLDIEVEDRISIGSFGLGDGTILGDDVYSRTTRFEVEVGPLTMAEYNAFLPHGKNVDGLKEIIVAMVGLEMSWQVRLVLHADEIKGVTLGSVEGPSSARLGYDSWMGDETNNSQPRRDMIVNDDDYALEELIH